MKQHDDRTIEFFEMLTREEGSRYEGEKRYVPYFHRNAEGTGLVEFLEGDALTYFVQPTDIVMFPELAGKKQIVLLTTKWDEIRELEHLSK